jgi:hypothetical protein
VTNLAGVKAVVFFLQDPLRERFPDCYREAAELAERARGAGIPVINPPEALSRSIKSLQARLWIASGIPTPAHYSFTDRPEFLAAVDQATFPAILRADLMHSQDGMRYLDSPEEALKIDPPAIHYPGTLTPFMDTREDYRASAPGTPWSELFHKKRTMVFGPHVRNNHLFFAPSPVVSSVTCTFGYYRSLNPVRRLRGRLQCRPHIDLDYRYFAAEPEQPEVFRKAAQTLGLDWLAIDYSTRADGSLVLWEANPYFSISGWPWGILPGPRRLGERNDGIFGLAGQYFQELLDR